MAGGNGFFSITTLDTDLARTLEPRTSAPTAKLKALEKLSAAGIMTSVNVAPVIPGLTDSEMPAILKAAKDVGAQFAGYVPLRFPGAVRPVFEEWLTIHRPLRKEKVLSAVRDIHEGKFNNAEFGERMLGSGARGDQISNLSRDHFKRAPQAGDQLNFEV